MVFSDVVLRYCAAVDNNFCLPREASYLFNQQREFEITAP